MDLLTGQDERWTVPTAAITALAGLRDSRSQRGSSLILLHHSLPC